MDKPEKSDQFDYFNETMRHNLVQEFAIAVYNHDVVPDVTEKSISDRGDYTHDFFTVEERDAYMKSVGRRRIVSYYQDNLTKAWHVKVVTKSFQDLPSLLHKYADVDTPVDDKKKVEKELYRMILVLMRQGRILKDFKLQPYRDQYLEDLTLKVASMGVKIDAIGKQLDNLEARVKKVEDIAAQTRAWTTK